MTKQQQHRVCIFKGLAGAKGDVAVSTAGLHRPGNNHAKVKSQWIQRHFKIEPWKSLSRVQLCDSPWNSLGQNTGVGSLSLL